MINSKLGYSRCAAPLIAYIAIHVSGPRNEVVFGRTRFPSLDMFEIKSNVFDTCVGNTIDWCGLYWFFGVIARFVETESRVWGERLYVLISACADLGLLPKAGATKAPLPAAPMMLVRVPPSRRPRRWRGKAHTHTVYNALCFYADLGNL